MRAFIAVELPAAVRASLATLQRELAAANADVKWVEEENLHVTMRFLGEIDEAQRAAIEQLLGTIATRHQSFQASLAECSAFPSRSSPRVIWAGIGQGRETLAQLAAEIEEELGALGLPKEDRGFVAHVTLGRVRSPKHRAQLVSRLAALQWTPPEPFRVEALTLFQSVLSSVGPSYHPLARLPFRSPV